jgi:hypothetical protein
MLPCRGNTSSLQGSDMSDPYQSDETIPNLEDGGVHPIIVLFAVGASVTAAAILALIAVHFLTPLHHQPWIWSGWF